MERVTQRKLFLTFMLLAFLCSAPVTAYVPVPPKEPIDLRTCRELIMTECVTEPVFFKGSQAFCKLQDKCYMYLEADLCEDPKFKATHMCSVTTPTKEAWTCVKDHRDASRVTMADRVGRVCECHSTLVHLPLLEKFKSIEANCDGKFANDYY